MFYGERDFTEINRRMEQYFAQENVMVFDFPPTRMRVTEIDISGNKIYVMRKPNPEIIPKTYGFIVVENGASPNVFPIKRISRDTPDFIIENPKGEPGVLGAARGPRLDLALAYGLGVSDENLSALAQETELEPQITDRIAQLVFS